jgi:hypothetical protein
MDIILDFTQSNKITIRSNQKFLLKKSFSTKEFQKHSVSNLEDKDLLSQLFASKKLNEKNNHTQILEKADYSHFFDGRLLQENSVRKNLK